LNKSNFIVSESTMWFFRTNIFSTVTYYDPNYSFKHLKINRFYCIVGNVQQFKIVWTTHYKYVKFPNYKTHYIYIVYKKYITLDYFPVNQIPLRIIILWTRLFIAFKNKTWPFNTLIVNTSLQWCGQNETSARSFSIPYSVGHR